MIRTPLVRKTPLKSVTPLKRTNMKRAPHAVPKPKRRRTWPKDVVDAVWRRSGGMCEAKAADNCRGYGGALHHRKMRSGGGPDTAENALHVCALCHHYIHHHPAEAYERGWLIRR